MIGQRWNHNIAYYDLVLAALPAGARRALDVGAGDGMLARALAASVPEVWAVEADGETLARARAEDPSGAVRYLLADFLRAELPPAAFDYVTSVASLHHMDARAALGRMRDLLRPGGRLVVVDTALPDWPADLPYEAAGAVMNRIYQATRGYWRVLAPTAPPRETYAQARRLAEAVLPGVRYRRRILWRYSLVWDRPASP